MRIEENPTRSLERAITNLECALHYYITGIESSEHLSLSSQRSAGAMGTNEKQ